MRLVISNFCLNPCSSGSVTLRLTWTTRIVKCSCLNPCSSGSVTLRNAGSYTMYFELSSLNPCSSGSVTLRVDKPVAEIEFRKTS